MLLEGTDMEVTPLRSLKKFLELLIPLLKDLKMMEGTSTVLFSVMPLVERIKFCFLNPKTSRSLLNAPLTNSTMDVWRQFLMKEEPWCMMEEQPDPQMRHSALKSSLATQRRQFWLLTEKGMRLRVTNLANLLSNSLKFPTTPLEERITILFTLIK